MPEPLHIFVSYSHKDGIWLEDLRVHLKPLAREGLVEVWDDTRIKAGERWKTEIKTALATTHVAILLVSKHFLASDFIINNELQPLLTAAEEKGVLILPVIVSPCRFQQTPSLSVFQAINNPNRPLARLAEWERDEIFVQITDRIESALQEAALAAETRVPARRPSKPRKKEGDPAAKVQQHKSSEPETNVRVQTEEKPPSLEPPREAPPQTWQNALGMSFARIPKGTFQMGSEDGHSDERPVHEVTISRPFYLGTTVVTQGQWNAAMGTAPWKGKDYVQEGDDYPAVYVSWEDAQAFIEQLKGRDGETYRLPTEAEWEYVCRSGSASRYSYGDDASALGEYAWYTENAWSIGERYAHGAGLKEPNKWGLYDMHGNVWEWVHDWFGSYGAGSVTDPTGPVTGSFRVYRGGSFDFPAGCARSAYRFGDAPGFRNNGLGFRLLRMAL